MEYTDARILLVDDEETLLTMVKELLIREGFHNIEVAGNCENALTLFDRGTFQLVLLDVMLPDGNGFELYQMMQKKMTENVPVIFLSARDEDSARLRGLGLGADDYVTKPFLPEELMLRVCAVLRRTYRFEEKGEKLVLGNTVIQWDSNEVIRAGEKKAMTAKEYALLRKLADNKGRIVTMDALCETLWPDGSYGLESSLMVHIRHLREKIEEDPSKPRYLLTVRGLGYKLEG